MKTLQLLLLSLVAALASCGGGSDATCRQNTPPLQYRLHYDVDATTGQYSPSTNADTFELATRFDAALLRPVGCGALGAVRFHWWPLAPAALVVRVYGAGSASAPGPLLHEQAVPHLLLNDWNVVTLTAPVDLAEGDLWISLEITTTSRGAATLGMDTGPKVAGVNFTGIDGTWEEYGGDHNFGIQALVWH